jgi:hypothetical protein
MIYKMKKTIAITIDFELAEKIKSEKNYSKMINDLLNDHYSMKALNEKGDKLTKEQLEELLKIAEKKEELKKQLDDATEEYNRRLAVD